MEGPNVVKNAPKTALSVSQERNLVNYLDERMLEITRNFKKRYVKKYLGYLIYQTFFRSEVSSNLQTLPAYLDAIRAILALILQIPPLDPSTGLRVAYLLRITGDVLGSIPGYRLEAPNLPIHSTLQDLLDFLDDLDQAWIAVLHGQVWDPVSAEGIDLVLPVGLDHLATSDGKGAGKGAGSAAGRTLKSSPPSQTDLARLRSLLFSGESTLEEWISKERRQTDTSGDDDTDDVSAMLAQMGLLDQFDNLFVRTLDYLGGFSGRVAQNTVNPEAEVLME